jgi:hypothetical protein
MIHQTIEFDQVEVDDKGEGSIINPTPVVVSADGESVMFTLGDQTWCCDQDALEAALTGYSRDAWWSQLSPN